MQLCEKNDEKVIPGYVIPLRENGLSVYHVSDLSHSGLKTKFSMALIWKTLCNTLYLTRIWQKHNTWLLHGCRQVNNLRIITNHPGKLSLPSLWLVHQVPACLAEVKAGCVLALKRQVTLHDPIRQVTLRSSETGSHEELSTVHTLTITTTTNNNAFVVVFFWN